MHSIHFGGVKAHTHTHKQHTLKTCKPYSRYITSASFQRQKDAESPYVCLIVCIFIDHGSSRHGEQHQFVISTTNKEVWISLGLWNK